MCEIINFEQAKKHLEKGLSSQPVKKRKKRIKTYKIIEDLTEDYFNYMPYTIKKAIKELQKSSKKKFF